MLTGSLRGRPRLGLVGVIAVVGLILVAADLSLSSHSALTGSTASTIGSSSSSDIITFIKTSTSTRTSTTTLVVTSSTTITTTVTRTTSTTTATTTSTTSTASSTSSTQAGIVQILLPFDVGDNESLNFQPATITVVIGVNNTIVWNDQDGIQHTVTSTSVPSGAQRFDSGIMNEGQTFTVTLTVPGVYHYDCAIHPDWMRGTIDVVR